MSDLTQAELRAERAELKAELLAFVASYPAVDAPRFDRLAERVARFQARAIPAYGRLIAARGWAGTWRTAPLVPTALFRDVDLSHDLLGPDVEAVFRTSGTTANGGVRGARRVPDMDLYEAAMRAPFVEHVLAGDVSKRSWWSLIPEAADLRDSSLSHMTSALSEELASQVVRQRPGPEVGPVVVMTTAFAIVQHLDHQQKAATGTAAKPPKLARGSRMMLTGGFKGKSRELDEGELLALIEEDLGIQAADVVPEYGMTELTSQAYGRPLAAPPWLRLRVVAPSTHRDVAPGVDGLVAFFDLLNLDNVSAIVTSDLGRMDSQGGLTLLGRAPGAVLRGCSLTAEALDIR